jgi:hypothetical protein
MFQPFLLLLISVKSMFGLSAAYEIAAAGRLYEAITLGSFAITPPVWCALKKVLAWPLPEELS